MSIKPIVAEEASKGNNGILRNAGVGVSGAPPKLCFSVKSSNRASLRSAGRGGSGAPIAMDEFEGGNEGGNVATLPRMDPVISPYAKQSKPGGVRKGGG